MRICKNLFRLARARVGGRILFWESSKKTSQESTMFWKYFVILLKIKAELWRFRFFYQFLIINKLKTLKWLMLYYFKFLTIKPQSNIELTPTKIWITALVVSTLVRIFRPWSFQNLSHCEFFYCKQFLFSGIPLRFIVWKKNYKLSFFALIAFLVEDLLFLRQMSRYSRLLPLQQFSTQAYLKSSSAQVNSRVVGFGTSKTFLPMKFLKSVQPSSLFRGKHPELKKTWPKTLQTLLTHTGMLEPLFNLIIWFAWQGPLKRKKNSNNVNNFFKLHKPCVYAS